ncbi:Disintegrin and metalloproteinase domain-containing protein 17 [Mactra antiquata]
MFSSSGHLDDRFHNYDLIKDVKVHSYSRRDVSEKRVTKQVTVSGFGQNYTLELTPTKHLFSRNFKITVIHSDDSRETIDGFNKNNFFTGHVAGQPGSSASVHITDDNVITGTFTTSDGEEFTIEPVSNLEDEGFPSSTMVIYRSYDIISDPENEHKCGSFHPQFDDDESEFDIVEFKSFNSEHHREKRATGLKTCKIAAVADYKYYIHMGNRNIFTTANYMANIINRINLIYKNTGFSGGNGYGFELDAMTIHDGQTADATSYNRQKTNWGTRELLEAFGKNTDYKNLCLSHLFTAESMPDSILGLAYIASSRAGTVGGVCSPTRTYNGALSVFNIGWSSSRNGAGNTVTFTQQALVTAHGHNWGSEHDPSSGDCAPGSLLGDGKYIMYAYAVAGEDSNNDLFSTCSIKKMNSVINSKASGCFTEETPYDPCGNGRIENDEQCDGGFLGSVGLDPCCSPSCTLNIGAQCSAANFPCCVNCQLASSSVQCQSDIEGSFDDSCKRCCRTLETGVCSVFDQSALLSNGRSCIQGYCQNGECKKVSTDMIERFWDLIDKISINFIIESFKTNMVACVTGFSLVLYIPICIIIWCIDRRRKKNWEKENSVHIRTDRTLAHDEDKRPVVNTDESKPTRSRPATLDASDLLDRSLNRRPGSRNQVQPLGSKPGSTRA